MNESHNLQLEYLTLSTQTPMHTSNDRLKGPISQCRSMGQRVIADSLIITVRLGRSHIPVHILISGAETVTVAYLTD